MNPRHIAIGTISALLCATLATSARADRGAPPELASPAAPSAQTGSAFTYQGQLRKNGALVNAICNASFALFDGATGGTQIGGTVTSSTLQVVNGLFTIPLDFGWNFNGEARWLETAIGCGQAPTTLSPRMALRPAPYALALPGMRTAPGDNDALANATMNVIGGVIDGAISNTISADSYNSVIGGGYQNRIDNASVHSVIGGGGTNRIDGNSYKSAISGGYDNHIDGNSFDSAIGGGTQNRIDSSSDDSIIGGGFRNVISGTSIMSAIGGGSDNSIEKFSFYSTIGGGEYNAIPLASFAAIPGGQNNQVEGDYGLAAGRRAKALHDGAFVWADSANADFASTANNQFLVRAGGGMGIGTGAPAAQLHVSSSAGDAMPLIRLSETSSGEYTRLRFTNDSVSPSDGYNNRWDAATLSTTFVLYTGKYGQFALKLTPGDATNYMTMGNGARLTAGGAWTNASDRNVKANFAAVDTAAVLEDLARVPIQTWNYRAEDPAVRHIGPMAQDFAQAFSVGQDDTHITTIDADGVALAAIQGLYRQNQELKAQNAELEARVSALERSPTSGIPGPQSEPISVSTLWSLLAAVGVAGLWLQQRRAKRGQA